MGGAGSSRKPTTVSTTTATSRGEPRLGFASSADGQAQGRGAVLAEVGFHEPPDTEGWVEIGYRVVATSLRCPTPAAPCFEDPFKLRDGADE